MRFWMCLILCLLGVDAAAARAVAVLPLDRAAGSDEHAGLGRALAGMLVSDLSKVEALELVERSRLDALLSEIELGKGGFVDPETAAKLGNGVGAEWVVVGSWSVVGDQFLMDARTVDVGTGKVVVAADASGTIGDFVTVEKTLVEDLLARLEVAVSAGARRKIIADAPTEDFEAVTTYAAGLQLEFEGDYAEARKKFEAAAARDPEFDLPLQRLSAIRLKLESLETERQDRVRDAYTQRMIDALARTPDEMSRTGRERDLRVVGKLALRFALLEHLGRHCQVVEEMRHYIDRHRKGFPTTSTPTQAYNDKEHAAFDIGLYDSAPKPWTHNTVSPPRSPYNGLVRGASGLIWPPGLIVGITDGIGRADAIGTSLANLTVTCAGPSDAARVDALAELKEYVEGTPFAKMGMYSNSDKPVWVELEILLLGAMAARDGMTAELQRRMDVLIELDISDDELFSVRADVQKIVGVAGATQRWNDTAQGLSDAELLRLAQAASSADASVLHTDAPQCVGLLGEDENARQLAGIGQAMEDGVIDSRERSRVGWMAIDYVTLRLIGCVRGVDPVIRDGASALAWADTLDKRLRAGRDEKACAENLKTLKLTTDGFRNMPPAMDGIRHGTVVSQGLRMMVATGCATVK